MKTNHHKAGETRSFSEPENVGGLGNGFSGISPEKHSACILNSPCIAEEREAESSNDAIVGQPQDSLAALGGLQQNASIAGSFTNILPLEHSLAIAYISSCRRDNQMVYVSPQITKLGFTQEAWLGKPDLRLQLVHEEDIGQVEQALRHSCHTAEMFNCHYRLYDSCGKVRWFHDEASVVCDALGTPLFIRGVMLEITDKKAMEAELHEHRYHLERNVEQRTDQLVRRITLLESCNATLCGKLALAKREFATLNQQACTLLGTELNDCTEQLYPRFY